MPIPYSITDSGLVFFARGRPYQVAQDHPRFENLKRLLDEPDTMPELLIEVVNWVNALDLTTGGRVNAQDGRFYLDDEPLPEAWTTKLAMSPSVSRVLLAREGGRVLIEGDEDCPDGVHVVSGIDLSDTERTLYVEDDEAGFYGYVSNSSVQEVLA